MKEPKANSRNKLNEALRALKIAIVDGSTWRYQLLVDAAVRHGATDQDIDAIAHEALETLLAGAEQPLTARELNARRSSGHFRRA